MRAAPTSTEALLWQALSGSQLGAPFRRQVVLGEYIVDFLAPSAKLVVEVDGGYHADRTRAFDVAGEANKLGAFLTAAAPDADLVVVDAADRDAGRVFPNHRDCSQAHPCSWPRQTRPQTHGGNDARRDRGLARLGSARL